MRKDSNVWGKPFMWWVEWAVGHIENGEPPESIRGRLNDASDEFGARGFADAVWRKVEERLNEPLV